MKIRELFKRNYDATVRRGQITDKTDIPDFIAKIREETRELELSYIESSRNNPTFDIFELADIVLTCFSMAIHFSRNLIGAIVWKILFNEERED